MFGDETIAAIATPPGIGGIAVIRLSGKNALTITGKIFRGKDSPCEMESHRVVYGRIVEPEKEEEIDEVLLTVLHAPHTYTGENTAEISCHGGFVPARRVLSACISAGARLAERGEFTKRAFLNGKMDLAQAEAVLDIVSAKTKEGLRSALEQRDGVLSCRIRGLKDTLVSIMTDLELSIDFADEDAVLPETKAIAEKIYNVITTMEEMMQAGKRAITLREGASAAIVGRPNVGKSSLLNALLLEERAIVTPVPGTTRDIIEGWISVHGIPLKLYDTAGFQNADNVVEAMGIKKTREAIQNTSFVLFVVDGSVPSQQEDKEIFVRAKEKPLIVVINKADLPKRIMTSDITGGNSYPECEVSAKEHTGIERLNTEILELIGAKDFKVDSAIPTRARHLMHITRAVKSLKVAHQGIGENRSLELIAYDIREAVQSLREIIGEVNAQEVLDTIFQEFCVGK